MGKSIKIFSAAAIALASVFVGVSAPAGASSAARFSVHRASRAAAVPNSNVSGKGAKAKFTPKKLTAHVYKTQANCADPSTTQSFTVTNATKGSYDITYNGSVVFTLPKNSIEDICFSGPAGTIQLGISGSTNTLTVKLTKKAV